MSESEARVASRGQEITLRGTSATSGQATRVNWTGVIRQGGPPVLEGTVGPSVAFLAGQELGGLVGALALALGWTAICMVARKLMGRHITALLLLGALMLALRSAVAVALHSASAFFVGPVVLTAGLGIAFVVSAFTTKPLANRLAMDLLPSSWKELSHSNPSVGRLVSALFGCEQVLSAALSVVLLLKMSTTAYVTFHLLVSAALFALSVIVSIPLLRSSLRRLDGSVESGARLRLALDGSSVPKTLGRAGAVTSAST